MMLVSRVQGSLLFVTVTVEGCQQLEAGDPLENSGDQLVSWDHLITQIDARKLCGWPNT